MVSSQIHGLFWFSGKLFLKKNSININFLVRISRGHSWPLRPDAQGSKSFSPPPGPQENALFGADVHDFRRGRPWPEGLSKTLYKKAVCEDVWAPIFVNHAEQASQISRIELWCEVRGTSRDTPGGTLSRSSCSQYENCNSLIIDHGEFFLTFMWLEKVQIKG